MAPKRPRTTESAESGSLDIVQNAGSISASAIAAQPAISEYVSRTGFLVGREPDRVVRHFGHLGEGLSATTSTPPETLETLRDRFLRRRELATFAIFPEGYEFAHHLNNDAPEQRVVILTPPNQIAMQDGDGTWHRRARGPEDPPAPYTMQWYMDHLRAHNLPPWFLSGPHTSMLHDNGEGRWLGREESGTLRQIPAPNYLELRYPETPQFPTADVFGTNSVYAYDINENEQSRLARHFPATSAIPPGSRIFIMPSGHIEIRHGRQNAGLHRPALNPGEQLLAAGTMVWQTELDNAVASHISDRRAATVDHSGSMSSTLELGDPATRQDIAQAARDRNGFPNLTRMPHGPGRWQWLQEEVDRPLAQALGYNTPEDVTEARQAGLLNIGMGESAGPSVVFYPLGLNVDIRPDGYGHFEYLTTGGPGSEEDYAHINFGGQEGFGFRDDPTPSAENIWELRQEYQRRIALGEIDEDYTDEIDLVWVPETEGERLIRMIGGTRGSTSPTSPTSTPSAPPTAGRRRTTGTDIGQVDPYSGLVHEPINRGENNQTGQHGEATYQTRLLPAAKVGNTFTPRPGAIPFTVDRARAHKNHKEDHKRFAVTHDGKWMPYLNWDTIDWTNFDSVEKLNKWREQSYHRYGWPPKRDKNRPLYSPDERRWIFESYVRPAQAGPRPSVSFAELTARFNRHFQQSRDMTGIQAVYGRLCTEYRKYGGKMKPDVTPGRKKPSGEKDESDESDESDERPVEDSEKDAEGEEG